MSGSRAALISVCFLLFGGFGRSTDSHYRQGYYPRTQYIASTGLKFRAVPCLDFLRAGITGTTVPSSFLSSTE